MTDSDSEALGVSPEAGERARLLLASDTWAVARTHLDAQDERTLAEQIALTEIPAPPFGEDARGRHMAELMRKSGLDDVTPDAEGNVVGWYPRPGAGPRPMVLAAHLDTVFPSGTDVRVRRTGGRLEAPGISDDGRGLAAVLAVVRALTAADVALRHPLMVAATVGEEGAGDLRGVRHLFGPKGAAADALGFMSLDGAGWRRIVSAAVGSRRFRVEIRGPGGHSWVDWGTANPVHALASAIAVLQDLELPSGATLSVGRVGGGTSVNAIPQAAWMEMEIRGRSEAALDGLEPEVRATLLGAVARANERRKDGTAELSLALEPMGVRPAGGSAEESAVVQAALAATDALGWDARLVASSTDANVPMALGIPSVTLGAGGEAGMAHTTEEWYENTGGPDGIARALLALLVLDELSG